MIEGQEYYMYSSELCGSVYYTIWYTILAAMLCSTSTSNSTSNSTSSSTSSMIQQTEAQLSIYVLTIVYTTEIYQHMQ